MKNTITLSLLLFLLQSSFAQLATIQVMAADTQQIIDGFGAHQGNSQANQAWWNQLFYDDLGASIYRVDLTPRLIAPYSNLSYYSPWFMGSGTDSVFNLEDPDNPDGPEGNRVRTYTNPNDYSRLFGGLHAPIAVMGPDIDANVGYFVYNPDGAIDYGLAHREALGDFKLIGSFWSPLPWVKVSSGHTWNQNWWPGPVAGAAWPFIWGGNFAGGRLDVSGTPLEVFNDATLGGTGPTSSLTQFARSAAAYVRGYQNYHNVQFYAISIQNELNFEEFYNSATYPLSSQYIAALKAVKAEFAQYDDLKDIKIMGPEDLLGGDAYGLWQYGGGANPTHKNLQYLQNIAADPEAAAAIDFFCIHGYGSDGVSASGATSTLWSWWANGWSGSPAAGIPGNVQGFTAFGKKSWMTETSGENPAWRSPTTGYPNNGAWSVALRIHQALTTGRESAWVYWTFTESDDMGGVTQYALTNQAQGSLAPKYVAAKHFFKYIRPNAHRVTTQTNGATSVLASAYLHQANGTLTVVLINAEENAETVNVQVPEMNPGSFSYETYTSQQDNYWQPSNTFFQDGGASVTVPGYGIVTLYGSGFTPITAVTDHVNNAYRLDQNQPNPCKEYAVIKYRIPEKQRVLLKLYDPSGKVLKTLVDEDKNEGEYEIGIEVGGYPAGIYVYKLEAGSFSASRKMEIIK